MKMTLQDKLVKGLLTLKYTEVHPPRQSYKYRIFSNDRKYKSGKPLYIFVGSKGALRLGPNSTQSHECNLIFRNKILDAASSLEKAFANLL